MKNIRCSECGDFRPADAKFCVCGTNDIEFKADSVSDLLNSRSTPKLLCAICGEELYGKLVYAYVHKDGWTVPGLTGKWWLSIRCNCGYDNSFDKFGIDR